MITLSVGESRPKKDRAFANLIMAVEKTDHSHTFVSWRDPRLDLRYVIEAKGAGIRIISNNHFKADNHVVRLFHYEVEQEMMDILQKWYWDQLAKPYGFKHIFGLFWMRIQMFFGKKGASNPFKDGEFSQICCELAVRSIEVATGIVAPLGVENYGLREAHQFNMKHGKKVPNDIVGRINGKTG